MCDLIENKDRVLQFAASSDSVHRLSKRKTLKESNLKELDFALFKWFGQERGKGVLISGPMIMKQVQLFHEK